MTKHKEMEVSDSQRRGSKRLSVRAVPEIILGGGCVADTFLSCEGGGCFVDSVSEGWGAWGVTCPGGQGIFDP